MGYIFTNKTAQTPLGLGPIGVTIDPGQSVPVTKVQAEKLQEHIVIVAWINEGKLHVEAVAEAPEPPEVPPVAPAPEEPPAPPDMTPPKVPTPTAKK